MIAASVITIANQTRANSSRIFVPNVLDLRSMVTTGQKRHRCARYWLSIRDIQNTRLVVLQGLIAYRRNAAVSRFICMVKQVAASRYNRSRAILSARCASLCDRLDGINTTKEHYNMLVHFDVTPQVRVSRQRWAFHVPLSKSL